MRTVNGHQRTGLCLQPSTGPCLHSSPNTWVPLGGWGQPAAQPRAPSHQLAAPLPRRAADGLAKCCNQVALTCHPQLQTYTSPQTTHTGQCPGPWS